MSFQKKSFYLFLGAWILLTTLALYNLSLQPSLPFTLQEGTDGISIGDTLTVSTKKTSYVPLIVDIDGIPATSIFDIEAILVGALVGSFIGFIIPKLHEVEPIAKHSSNRAFQVSFQFSF